MNTIEERAYQHYPIGKCNDIIESMKTDAGWDGYILGATDQRKIDIEKACEYIRQRSYGYSSKTITDNFIKGLKQAMEES